MEISQLINNIINSCNNNNIIVNSNYNGNDHYFFLLDYPIKSDYSKIFSRVTLLINSVGNNEFTFKLTFTFKKNIDETKRDKARNYVIQIKEELIKKQFSFGEINTINKGYYYISSEQFSNHTDTKKIIEIIKKYNLFFEEHIANDINTTPIIKSTKLAKLSQEEIEKLSNL